MTSLRPNDADEAFGAAVFRVPGGNSPAGLVIVRGAQFACLGDRSLLPLVGEAAVAYVPARGSVVGLSKLARLVMALSRRAQSLEGLAAAVRDAVVRRLAPLGVAAVVVASDASKPWAAPRTAAAAAGCLAGARLVEVLAALRLAAARSGAPRPAPLGELVPRGAPGCVLSSRDGEEDCGNGKEGAGREPREPPPALTAAIRTLIECCGEDADREGLAGSAERLAGWLLEATSGGPGEERTGWSPAALETRAGWGDASDPSTELGPPRAAPRSAAPRVLVSAYESASETSGTSSLQPPPLPSADAGSVVSASAPSPPRSPSPCGRGRATAASSTSPSSRPSSPDARLPSCDSSPAAAPVSEEFPARSATPFSGRVDEIGAGDPRSSVAALAATGVAPLGVCAEPSTTSGAQAALASRVASASSFSESFSEEAAPTVVYRSEFCPPSRLRRKPPTEAAKAFSRFPAAELPAPEEGREVEWSASTPFSSLCEHHLLPFYGTMRVLVSAPARRAGAPASPSLAELRAKALCAVSKASRRMQMQERICAAVADELEALVSETSSTVWRQATAADSDAAKGCKVLEDVVSDGCPASSQASIELVCAPCVLVVAEATHMCMVARGAAQHASSTVTIAARGAWEHDDAARAAALCRLMDAELAL